MTDSKIKINKQYLVETQVIINKIGKIDTLNSTFYAELYLNVTWLDELNSNIKLNNFNYDSKKYFNPNVIIANLIDEPIMEEIKYDIQRTKNSNLNEIKIMEIRKLSGTFWHEFYLKYFPIDVQSLNIEVKSNRSFRDVKLIESKEKFSCLNPFALMNTEEWTIQSCLKANAFVTQNEISMENYSSFVVAITASRLPRFYFYNLFLLILLITVIGLTRFTVTCDLPQVRLIIDQMVTLTLITFKSVANANLPTISYLTSVDKYLLFSIVFIMLQCIYDAVIGVITLPVCAAPYGFYDLMAFITSILLIFLANLGFIIWLIFFALKNKKKLYKQIDMSINSNSDRLFSMYTNSMLSKNSNENEIELNEDNASIISDTNSVYSEEMKF